MSAPFRMLALPILASLAVGACDTRTGPDAAKDRPRATLSARHALRDVAVYGVEPPRPMWAYGSDVDAYKADLARRDAALRSDGRCGGG